jgi:hypothetical protein
VEDTVRSNSGKVRLSVLASASVECEGVSDGVSDILVAVLNCSVGFDV